MRKTSPPSSALPKFPAGRSIAIVCSSYYEELIAFMEDAACEVLSGAGAPEERILTLRVPGSFEIPLACQAFLQANPSVAGIIALGIIIRGETHHASEIARACTDGLMQVQLHSGIPIAHAVLFVDSLEQARVRCAGKENRGAEAAHTLLKMMTLKI